MFYLLRFFINCNMKKQYLITSILLTTIILSGNSQNLKPYQSLKELNNDTLKYIRASFIDRKEIYVNKNFEGLLKDLEIPIKSYLVGTSNRRDISRDISK